MKIWIFWSTNASNLDIINISKEIWKFLWTTNNIIVTWWVNWYAHVVAEEVLSNWWEAIVYGVWQNIDDHNIFHSTDLANYSNIIFQEKYFEGNLSYFDNYLRSLKMCSEVDIAIIIGWRVWTMYEMTMLSWLWKDIFVLANSWWITLNTIKEFIKEWHKRDSKISFFDNVDELKNLIK